MTPILRTENVEFRSILRYPPLSISREKTTFLTGPSGCGKSTLLRLFNGVLSPDGGTVYYEGRDIATLDPIRLRREVLLTGQSSFLFPGSIRENFRLYRSFRDEAPVAEALMENCLALCQAEFSPDALCDHMSGGERQRIFLAICLSLGPRVLMLDEPTSALDSATADRLMGAVKSYCGRQGITLVAVSHDSALAERYGDEQIMLTRGDVL